MALKDFIKKTPVLFRAALFLRRSGQAGSFVAHQAWKALRWLFGSREFTNTTYRYTARNMLHLAVVLDQITGAGRSRIMGLFSELEQDESLRAHLMERTLHGPGALYSDTDIRYTRRIAWYALTRILHPNIVVETGVDKGLGSAVLCAALLKNKAEGFPGYYYGTDINPEAGFLLSGIYASTGKILYGDSIDSINQLEGPIDLFINDSDHSELYEAREYVAAKEKLSEKAVIIGDNSHCNDRLLEFADTTGRVFCFHREQPQDHFYPGDGIGFAFPKQGFN
jgi:hypothetical protein